MTFGTTLVLINQLLARSRALLRSYSFPVTPDVPHPLWNTKHHHRIEMNPSLFPVLSQIFFMPYLPIPFRDDPFPISATPCSQTYSFP